MLNSNQKSARVEKRNRIIEASISVFADHGYHSARVSDIAKLAGVADGTIYLYFKNKEDLLLSIFEEKMDELIQATQMELNKVERGLEQIRVFAQQHFIQVQKFPKVAQVLQVELRQSQKFIREYRPEKLWEYLSLLRNAIKKGQNQGDIGPEFDPFLLQWTLFGALDEMSIQWILSKRRDRFNLDEAASQISRVFINGLSNQSQ